MPVPENVVRANIRATNGPSEEMVHTLHFKRVNTTTEPEPSLQAIANKIVEEWTEFLVGVNNPYPAINTLMHSNLIYTTVDTYELGVDGRATEQAQAAFGATAKGVAAGTPLPPEVACVASLRTGLPGRSRRGRLYLGGFTTATVIAGGLVSGSLQGAITLGLAKFGTDMKFPDVGAIDRLNWSVLSRTLTQTNRITQIRCGNVWDVQRRRQNGLLETYGTASINY